MSASMVSEAERPMSRQGGVGGSTAEMLGEYHYF
jgi:hypothetical protein